MQLYTVLFFLRSRAGVAWGRFTWGGRFFVNFDVKSWGGFAWGRKVFEIAWDGGGLRFFVKSPTAELLSRESGSDLCAGLRGGRDPGSDL